MSLSCDNKFPLSCLKDTRKAKSAFEQMPAGDETFVGMAAITTPPAASQGEGLASRLRRKTGKCELVFIAAGSVFTGLWARESAGLAEQSRGTVRGLKEFSEESPPPQIGHLWPLAADAALVGGYFLVCRRPKKETPKPPDSSNQSSPPAPATPSTTNRAIITTVGVALIAVGVVGTLILALNPIPGDELLTAGLFLRGVALL